MIWIRKSYQYFRYIIELLLNANPTMPNSLLSLATPRALPLSTSDYKRLLSICSLRFMRISDSDVACLSPNRTIAINIVKRQHNPIVTDKNEYS